MSNNHHKDKSLTKVDEEDADDNVKQLESSNYSYDTNEDHDQYYQKTARTDGGTKDELMHELTVIK